MSKTYDLIIIGGGSIGIPAALETTKLKYSVLVIDSLPSPGQGENKKAIGGIRATHSDACKISLCQRSIEIFSRWKETYGTDIHWRSNGYSYPAYTEEDETNLRNLMKVQKSFGLNIKWISPEEYQAVNPRINMTGLRGSTFSPEDGSASPLLFVESCYDQAVKAGAEFRFKEKVRGFQIKNNQIEAVETDKGRYACGRVLNAAGIYAKEIAQMAGLDSPVYPDSHEGCITEPVKPFVGPMVVDIRHRPGSANFYFYQAMGGQVIGCLTPDPPDLGADRRATSRFLPMYARRMVEVMPCLANLKVRRTWRGLYPNTPDGFPMVGQMKEVPNFYQSVGMCGQGFMLGPGLGELLGRMLTNQSTAHDLKVLNRFDLYRKFTDSEKLH
ncbi:MAG: FAD-binding oxidoreductase [Deltaproteobacteria bacterium]|nr:FAD-binding oxidoreductase [Deltaproteobacteria bacterium]